MAREIRRKGAQAERVLPVEELFSAMPPLEAVKLLCTLLVIFRFTMVRKKPLKLGLYDISRAHFYADATREVYVRLP